MVSLYITRSQLEFEIFRQLQIQREDHTFSALDPFTTSRPPYHSPSGSTGSTGYRASVSQSQTSSGDSGGDSAANSHSNSGNQDSGNTSPAGLQGALQQQQSQLAAEQHLHQLPVHIAVPHSTRLHRLGFPKTTLGMGIVRA